MSDDNTDLGLGDEGDGPRLPDVPRPTLDLTMRLMDGTVVRVATAADVTRLTIAGPDGMATAELALGDVEALGHALDSGGSAARRARNGTQW